MNNTTDNFDDIENYGRAALPQLPPELRVRTLTRCAQIVNQQNRKRRHRGWALIGTLAGVCAIHWLAISALNAQNNILMGENNSNQTAARFAMTPDEFHQLQKQRAEIMANSGIEYGRPYMFGNIVGE